MKNNQIPNFRTDLADERTEICKSQSHNKDIDGIETTENKISNNISVNTVNVLNENGSKKIDKKVGKYITINISNIDNMTKEDIKLAEKILKEELNKCINDNGPILVVGLGNEDTTADSIGPKVIKDLKITRHLLEYMKNNDEEKNIREVSAIAPGVLGTTGIETQEIIKGVVEKIKVSGIIVIDALASNNISRLLKTIQICNTGIIPGSGVYNKRKEISLETMGVPVIAIGVPTVVEAATIVANTFDILVDKFDEFAFLKDSTYQEKYTLIKMVLDPCKYNLAVMPKEIDELVDNMREIISNGINDALVYDAENDI